MSNTITMSLTEDEEEKLLAAWGKTRVKTPPYAKWQLKPENCVITCYQSGKTLFQGKDAKIYASPFIKAPPAGTFPQAGSDEVGTGDYFGGIAVCACLVSKDTYPLLLDNGVRDSKKLTDDKIRRIAPLLAKKLPHAVLILDSSRYNELHAHYNMVKLKSLLHNRAYVALARRGNLPSFKIIDQFVGEQSYYACLKDEAEVVTGIHFETKADDKYPSVGAASVLARYAFLQQLEKMRKICGINFPSGAQKNADEAAAAFVKKYGSEKLGEVAKLHFKNTEAILSSAAQK